MNKILCKKIKRIFIFLIIVFSLFSNLKVIAVTDDDGPAVDDKNIIWHTTCFGGEALGATNPATRTSL